MHVESLNVGPAVDVPWGAIKSSAIDKRPVHGPRQVDRRGIAGDEIADLKHHGGPDQAVYAFAGEDIEDWSARLARPLAAGQFGENLTTRGIDVNAAKLGERWRVGTTLLEVTGVRIPCSVFGGFMDEPQWVQRFTRHGRPGAYLRVIEVGEVSAGDAIEVVERREHHLTIGFTFRALTTERHLAAQLLAEPRISERVRARATRK